MKKLLSLSLILLSTICLAQKSDELEEVNQKKINDLNQRLDHLLEGQKDIKSDDSLDYKLKLLFTEIRELKKEVEKLNTSVKQLESDNERDIKEPAPLEKYYVVIASRRDKARADLALESLSKKEEDELKMVQNIQGSWYHIILENAFEMKEAIKRTSQFKNSGTEDCWWVTGKRLKEI